VITSAREMIVTNFTREIDKIYGMISAENLQDDQFKLYLDFVTAGHLENDHPIQNCFDDYNMQHMDLLSEKQDEYLEYLKKVNNTQFICTRNLNIVKFKEMEKFKYRVIPELGLVWGYKKHIRCGGIDLSNFILRCIALEYIKV
jgi:hypothetical protein